MQRMQWEKMHPGYNTEYIRKYRAEKKRKAGEISKKAEKCLNGAKWAP